MPKSIFRTTDPRMSKLQLSSNINLLPLLVISLDIGYEPFNFYNCIVENKLTTAINHKFVFLQKDEALMENVERFGQCVIYNGQKSELSGIPCLKDYCHNGRANVWTVGSVVLESGKFIITVLTV